MCYRLIIAVATASLGLADIMNNDFRAHNITMRVGIITDYGLYGVTIIKICIIVRVYINNLLIYIYILRTSIPM